MVYIFTGFRQTNAVRQFAFDCVAADGTRYTSDRRRGSRPREKALYSAPGSPSALPASAGDFRGQGSYGDLDVYGSRYARRGDCDSSCESGEKTCSEAVCFEPPGTGMAVAGSTGLHRSGYAHALMRHINRLRRSR